MMDGADWGNHMNDHSEMKSDAMVRKGLSALSIFSSSRRRESGHCDGDKACCHDDEHRRKVSVDNTVLLADDSRHTPSRDFSRSFDFAEFLHPNFTRECTADEYLACGASMSTTPPPSHPSIFHIHDTDAGLHPCIEPSRSITPQDNELIDIMRPCPGIGGAPLQSLHPHFVPQPASYRSSNPALQARIDAIRIQQKLLGQNHPDVIFALSSLAKLQLKRGNHIEAAAIMRESQLRSTLAQSCGYHCAQDPQESQQSDIPTEIIFSPQV
jgi:hypothetical protein